MATCTNETPAPPIHGREKSAGRSAPRSYKVQDIRENLRFPVVADRLDRATLKGLGAQCGLLIGFRLLGNEGVTTLLVPREKIRSGLTAQVTINALLVYVEFTSDVVGPFLSFVRHSGERGSRRK